MCLVIVAQPEAFAYLPLWLAGAFVARGGAGWWSGCPPQIVLGHTVTLNYPSLFKNYIWKVLGYWHWQAEEVSAAFLSPRGRLGRESCSTCDLCSGPLLLS